MHRNFDSSTFLKLTYHEGDKKWNTYIPCNPYYDQVRGYVDNFVFEMCKKPRSVLRHYWIDEESDEIDICNQDGYQVFFAKNQDKRHLHVASLEEQQKQEKEPVKVEAKNVDSAPKNVKTTPSIPDDDPSNFSIHDGVECDSCKVAPIVGFRYKCIQCPNFDLCQRCEWQHNHREHMMVRMPHANCPSVVEAWISGRYGRRGHGAHKRTARGTCPFMPPPTGTAGTTSAEARDATGTCKRDSSHRHSRRQMRNGVFSHLYEMMQGLAEGGAAVATESEEEAETASGQAREAADEAVKAAETAASKATEAATKAAEAAAAQVAHNIASACAAGAANAAFKLAPPTAPEQSANSANEPKAEQREAGSNNNATPVVDSPSLENIAQFIDPQYMKAGLQILNNFSEMFAKMLDPAEGAGGSCPFQGEGYQARKASTDSAATTTSHKNAQQQQKQETGNKSNIETAVATSTTSSNGSPVAATPIKDAQTPDRRRSHSEDNDWQLIDQHSTSSNEDLSNERADSGANVATAAAAATTTNTTDGAAAIAAATTMNYEQLSKTLKAHVEEEQKREQLAKEQTTQTPTVTPAATAPIEETNNNNTTPTTTATNPEPAPIPAPVPRARTPEEKRAVPVYHTDQRINNAVHAMMAMGFSNEGAWLTQLLESVNGNIAEALDLMSTAQRSNR